MTPAPPAWTPAILQAPASHDKIQCGLCPYRCQLADGQTGICQVRRNHGGSLQTATFTVAMAHLDAIERKPLYHMWPGLRVLTIAGPGCTFRCDYCINYRLSQYGRNQSAPWTGDPADPAALVRQAGVAGAAIGLSYAEPGLAPELTLALAEHAVPSGIPLVWKSNGFLTRQAIDLVAPALTAVNIDIKAAEEAAHRRLTGAPLRPVLDAVERFRAAGVWVEVSTPLIPGVSADATALRVIADRLAALDRSIPWHLLRFTPDFKMATARPTPPDELSAARRIGQQAGLQFVYVERALGPEGRHTRCPSCLSLLVARGIWQAQRNLVTDGRCPRCSAVIPGVWEERA